MGSPVEPAASQQPPGPSQDPDPQLTHTRINSGSAASKAANGAAIFAAVASRFARSGVNLVTSGATLAADGVTRATSTVLGVAADVGSVGLGGIQAAGGGFRDFFLKNQVVDLAVAVVIGMAFTSLMEAFTKSFISPALGAMFAGSNFLELSFTVNGSAFMYGQFINALIVFLLVILVLYYGVVAPLQHLMYSAYSYKALKRDCPHCTEEISLISTRCKWCCGEINATPEEVQAMAAALQAFNLRHLTRCTRACAPCTSCFGRCAGGRCCRGKQQAQEQGDQQCVDEESLAEAEAVQLIERFHSALPHAHAFLASTGQLPGRVPLRSMSMGAVHKSPSAAAAGGLSARGGGDVEQGAAAAGGGGGGGGMHRSVSDQGPQRRQQQQQQQRDVSGGRATGRGTPDQGLCCDPLQQQ